MVFYSQEVNTICILNQHNIVWVYLYTILNFVIQLIVLCGNENNTRHKVVNKRHTNTDGRRWHLKLLWRRPARDWELTTAEISCPVHCCTAAVTVTAAAAPHRTGTSWRVHRRFLELEQSGRVNSWQEQVGGGRAIIEV